MSETLSHDVEEILKHASELQLDEDKKLEKFIEYLKKAGIRQEEMIPHMLQVWNNKQDETNAAFKESFNLLQKELSKKKDPSMVFNQTYNISYPSGQTAPRKTSIAPGDVAPQDSPAQSQPAQPSAATPPPRQHAGREAAEAAASAAIKVAAPEAAPFADLIAKQGVAKVAGWMKFVGFVLVALLVLLFLGVAGYAIGALASLIMDNIIYIILACAVLGGILILFSDEVRKEFFTTNGVFFLITLILHCYFISIGFLADTQMILIAIGAYLLVSALYVVLNGWTKENLTFALTTSGLTILLLAAPPLLKGMNTNDVVLAAISFFIIVLPIWPLFLLNNIKSIFPNGYASWVFKTIIVIVVLIAFVIVFSGLIQIGSLLPKNNLGQSTDAGQQVNTFWDWWSEKLGKSITDVGNKIDVATNPAKIYSGQIEQNSDKQKELGVSIDALQAQDKQLANDTPIVINGAVNAKSFIGTSVNVQPSCVIDRKNIAPASVDPVSMDVVYGYKGTFQCTFAQLPTGSYTVKGAVTFPFETWAYEDQVFIDEERANAIARQGKDVKQLYNLGIAAKTVYTNGPIAVGMTDATSTYPIRINTAKDPMIDKSTTIGMTIESNWASSGELKRVNAIQIKVPPPFALQDCSRNQTKEPMPDPNATGYTDYFFENQQLSEKAVWSSITCHLYIPQDKKDDAIRLLSEGDVVRRTFIGVADYDYKVTKSISVTVR